MVLFKPYVMTCAFCGTGKLATGLDGRAVPESYIPCTCGNLFDQLPEWYKKKKRKERKDK